MFTKNEKSYTLIIKFITLLNILFMPRQYSNIMRNDGAYLEMI